MDNRDRFEELFREKLQNWDFEPEPEAWETISGQISTRKYRFFSKSLYRLVATVTLLLMVGTGLVLMKNFQKDSPAILTSGGLRQDSVEIPGTSIIISKDSLNIIEKKTIPTTIPIAAKFPGQTVAVNFSVIKEQIVFQTKPVNTILLSGSPSMELAQTSLPRLHPTVRNRKWHFGMGGGSLSLAGLSTSSSGYPDYVYNNDFQRPEQPKVLSIQPYTRSLNSLLSQLNPTKVKRSIPVSFGLSASRTLSERWSFSTGLTYSFLRLQWRYDNSQYDILRQRVHLLGIPASFSYRLSNDIRPYWYFTAGILCEINMTSKLYTAYQSERSRIPGVLWTANTRLGVAYPIVRYISVYAEGGFLYNFTPNSEIRTLRSEKNFNLSGQLGLRLHF